jgi:hypothetical protein
MKTIVTALMFTATVAMADSTVITPYGSNTVSTYGTTTYVTGTGTRSSAVTVSVPVTVNPVTGIGQVITPTGSYMVQRSASGNTTTVIQTSKGK